MQWATIDEVKSWKPNSADGLVQIPLADSWVWGAIDFKRIRAEIEIFKVGNFISNVEIRKEFTTDLEAILSSSGDKRVISFINLINTIAGSLSSKNQMYEALRFLSNESGYRNNPFLLLAIAQTKSNLTNSPQFGTNALVAESIKALNENLYGKNPKITRSEAAVLNQFASNFYTKLNAQDLATETRWMERIYGMSNNERTYLQEGDIYSIMPPGPINSQVNPVRDLYKAEKDFNQNEKKFAQDTKIYDESNQIGKEQNFDLKGDHRQSEYFQRRYVNIQMTGIFNIDAKIYELLNKNPSDVIPMNETKIVKDRSKPKGQSKKVVNTGVGYKNIAEIVGEEGVADGHSMNTRADALSSVVGIYLEYAKWRNTNERMKVITSYLRKKEEIERRIAKDYYRVVPPPADVLEKYIRDLRRDGKITAHKAQKTKIYGLLSDLEKLLRESRALGNKK